MTDHQGAYESNLNHIAEPAAPSERDEARSVRFEDWQALWLTDHLRAFAHYDAEGDQRGIAVGLSSYIDKKVRDEGKSHVRLYLHTHEAVTTLLDALDHARDESTEISAVADEIAARAIVQLAD